MLRHVSTWLILRIKSIIEISVNCWSQSRYLRVLETALCTDSKLLRVSALQDASLVGCKYQVSAFLSYTLSDWRSGTNRGILAKQWALRHQGPLLRRATYRTGWHGSRIGTRWWKIKLYKLPFVSRWKELSMNKPDKASSKGVEIFRISKGHYNLQ